MTTSFKERVAQLVPDIAAIRRDIHAHPELSMQEVRTSALVAARLRDWGLEVTEGVGKFGVVGTLRGRLGGQRSIGLRADMDALAITEQTGLPHASTNSGVMHACGHDGHTAMLLGAARALAEQPDFGGTIHFVFQPAEEAIGGARAMIADGLFERFPCDAIYGLHNSPGLPVGQFRTRPGPLMAAGDRWTVVFRGKGGHGGSAPYLTTDLTIVQAHFLLGLQTIIGRNLPASESAVVSAGFIQAGSPDAVNVMPAELTISGVCRTYKEEVRDVLEARMRALAESFASAHDCTAEVEYLRRGIAVVNHAEQTEVALAAARAVAGAEKVDGMMTPSTGAEDFAAMLQRCPGAFMFIGNGVGTGPGGSTPALHTPAYDFNDAILPDGIAYWIGLARQELSWGGTPLA